MDCTELEQHLTDFLEGDLSSEDEREALDHLASCDRCEEILAGTRRVSSLGATFGRFALTDDERRSLLRKILSVESHGHQTPRI